MSPRSKRPRTFPGFTKAEVKKMEQILSEHKDQSLDEDFFKKLTKQLNRSGKQSRKPRLKWNEIQSWFEENKKTCPTGEPSFDAAAKSVAALKVISQKITTKYLKLPEGVKYGDMLENMEFEAKSPRDGAWYDVHSFISHKSFSSGEIEVLVRYAGFGKDQDEWVTVKHDVRERSVALEHTECEKLKADDQVLCFRESEDGAMYFDAEIKEIQRRQHDVRGCRCIFSIKYKHDNKEETVDLKSLCCSRDMLASR